MLGDRNTKKILHLTVSLALVAAPVGGALAFANNMMAPVIATNELVVEKETLKETHPDMGDDTFVKVRGDTFKTIGKVLEVEGKGYILRTKVARHKDGINYLMVPNRGRNVYDHVAISNGDTQGLGSKVTEKPPHESLKGKDTADEEVLNDTITEATVSSKPVIEGIRETTKYQAENLK